jgi:hypothetical protein
MEKLFMRTSSEQHKVYCRNYYRENKVKISQQVRIRYWKKKYIGLIGSNEPYISELSEEELKEFCKLLFRSKNRKGKCH